MISFPTRLWDTWPTDLLLLYSGFILHSCTSITLVPLSSGTKPANRPFVQFREGGSLPFHLYRSPTWKFLALELLCLLQSRSSVSQEPLPRLPILCAAEPPGAASSHLQLPQSCDLAVTAACLAQQKGKVKTR